MKSRHLFWIIAVFLGVSLFSARGWATACRNDDDCPADSPCVKIEYVGQRCLPDVGIWVIPQSQPNLAGVHILPVNQNFKQASRYVSWMCQSGDDCEDGSVCTQDGQCVAETENGEPATGGGDDDPLGDLPPDSVSTVPLFVEHIRTPLPRMFARSNLRWFGSGRLVPVQLPPGTDVGNGETADDPTGDPNDTPIDELPTEPIGDMDGVEQIEGGGGCALAAGIGASSGGGWALLLIGFIAIAVTSLRMRLR